MSDCARLEGAIHALEKTIAALVEERQRLRDRGAGRPALEANRLDLGRRQRELSYALIGCHLPRLDNRAAA